MGIFIKKEEVEKEYRIRPMAGTAFLIGIAIFSLAWIAIAQPKIATTRAEYGSVLKPILKPLNAEARDYETDQESLKVTGTPQMAKARWGMVGTQLVRVRTKEPKTLPKSIEFFVAVLLIVILASLFVVINRAEKGEPFSPSNTRITRWGALAVASLTAVAWVKNFNQTAMLLIFACSLFFISELMRIGQKLKEHEDLTV
jgi:hypothetical protein